MYGVVCSVVAELLSQEHRLVFTPQVSREIWSVLTRPASNNGFGLSPELAEPPMREIEKVFTLVDDKPGIYAIWKKLVHESGVSGRQVHDANHVAAMLAHGIHEILTLDERDFRRYPGIRIRNPE